MTNIRRCADPIPSHTGPTAIGPRAYCLITDGAYEEQNDGELRFLAAPPPTPERMTAVLAQVHEVVRAADDDLDLDPALAACL